MNKNYLYKYYQLKAKADYHFTNAEILSKQLDNETDPDSKRRICARRSRHRRLYRKYHAMAENTWVNMR